MRRLRIATKRPRANAAILTFDFKTKKRDGIAPVASNVCFSLVQALRAP
jgi:hypothetical protein